MSEKKTFRVHAEIVAKLMEDDVEDIVCTAIEGGIGYWCCLDNTTDAFEEAPDDEPTAITAAKVLLDGGKIRLLDEEDEDKPYFLDIEALMQGFRLWIERGYDYYGAVACNGEVDVEQIDAPAADAIFQLALFGDVVYG